MWPVCLLCAGSRRGSGLALLSNACAALKPIIELAPGEAHTKKNFARGASSEALPWRCGAGFTSEQLRGSSMWLFFFFVFHHQGLPHPPAQGWSELGGAEVV